MKKALILSIATIMLLSFTSKPEVNDQLIAEELELDSVFKKLRKSYQNTDFVNYNKEFKAKMKEVLAINVAFTFPFDSLQSMSKITSPDEEFRLFNWNVEMENGMNNFFCLILKKDGTIIELKDNYRNIISPELKTLSQTNWYGACYYKIIPMGRGKYTLLGWNGKDDITTQKVIETMSLGSRNAKFGFALFNFPDQPRVKKKRIILEYSNEAYVSLKHFETKKQSQIVFSHLSPSTKQMEGYPQYYYPDLSYDRFVLKKGKWVFESDVTIKNDKSKTDDLFNAPE